MTTESKPSPNPLQRSAKCALWASGLCFGLSFMVGLSGVASITLGFDTYTITRATGLESAVFAAVDALETPITLLHAWGGYVIVLLGGWSGFEFFRLARAMTRSTELEIRKRARLTGVAGVFGAIILVISVVLLSVSGVSTSDKLKAKPPRIIDSKSNQPPPVRSFQVPKRDEIFERHTGGYNLFLGLGAILMVVAVTGAQRVRQLKDKSTAQEESDEKTSEAE